MKKLILAVLLLIPFAAVADQRFETWQGLCHFAYDPADDDNEIYFANCINTIDTYDAGDGQGRLAYGAARTKQTYDITKGTYPGDIISNNIKLKGVDSVAGDDYLISNTDCVMVTSNYNAGADDNNETEYRTNDWELEVVLSPIAKRPNDMVLVYQLNCRGGVAQ